MKKPQTIGYVYSYTDISDSCDGYPRISKLYKTKNGCKKAMLLDAKEYANGEDKERCGNIIDHCDKVEVEFECDCYCLYSIHEVKK